MLVGLRWKLGDFKGGDLRTAEINSYQPERRSPGYAKARSTAKDRLAIFKEYKSGVKVIAMNLQKTKAH